MADRIRWSDGSGGQITGCAGTLDPFPFVLAPPLGPGDEWLLLSRLPGQESITIYGNGPESLKPEAEQLFAKFVPSLGAVFPDENPPAREGR